MDVNKNHQQQNQQKSKSNNDTGRENEAMDPTTKLLIRQAIVNGGGGDDDNGGRAEIRGPSEVLAFTRSVNKTDSSLEWWFCVLFVLFWFFKFMLRNKH